METPVSPQELRSVQPGSKSSTIMSRMGKAASGRLKTETIMVSPAAPPPGTLLVATEEVTPTKMARRKAKPSRGTPNIVVASTSA